MPLGSRRSAWRSTTMGYSPSRWHKRQCRSCSRWRLFFWVAKQERPRQRRRGMKGIGHRKGSLPFRMLSRKNHTRGTGTRGRPTLCRWSTSHGTQRRWLAYPLVGRQPGDLSHYAVTQLAPPWRAGTVWIPPPEAGEEGTGSKPAYDSHIAPGS
jgi:hypothetical protein